MMKKSDHRDTRYVLTLAGFYATEDVRQGEDLGPTGPLRPRNNVHYMATGIPYVITPAGMAALAAAECDHRSGRCIRCAASGKC